MNDKTYRSSVRQQKMQRLRWLSRLLDSSIRLPGGYRIGLDGIIGLIPGIGDAFTGVASGYIILEAARMGASTGVLLRMVFNVLLESVLGIIPLFGDLFDFVWKSNQRNVRLLEEQAHTLLPDQEVEKRLTMVAVIVLLVLLAGIVGAIWLAFEMLLALFSALGGG